MDIKYKINIMLYAQSAEPGPPLGTMLGNLGVNTVKFCKEFNDFTLELPNYIKMCVLIYIYENKSFTFTINLPPLGYIIKLLKKEKVMLIGDNSIIVEYLDLFDVLQLVKFKFPFLSLAKGLKIVTSSIHSAGLFIDND